MIPELSLADMLAQFHSTYGVAGDSDFPTVPAPELRTLRRDLLREEYDEYIIAQRDLDVIEVADALGDMVYIAAGSHRTWGVGLSWDRWERPSSPAMAPDLNTRLYATDTIRTAVTAYELASEACDPAAVGSALYRVILAVQVTAQLWQIPMGPVLDEIHRSNMSKLFPPDETNPDWHPKYRDDGKVLKGPNTFKPDLARVLREYAGAA